MEQLIDAMKNIQHECPSGGTKVKIDLITDPIEVDLFIGDQWVPFSLCKERLILSDLMFVEFVLHDLLNKMKLWTY